MSIHSSLTQRPNAGRQPGFRDTSCNPVPDDAQLLELTRGLLATPASVSPKYLYDTLGSKLFETLCLLPEYYPTRTEAAILDSHLADIADVTPQNSVLIDLGAGNCAKAEKLFNALAPSHYIAVDISAEFLQNALRRLRPRYPNIKMKALGQDFSSGLILPDDVPTQNRLFFYPGSSLGNFAPAEAHRFLKGLQLATNDKTSLLLGIDLVKDSHILNAAYDDALGITSAFNLNLLRNLNRVLNADFDVRDWQHQAFFNKPLSRVEMHLQARRAVTVRWNDQTRNFAAGERIHTENSHKYTRASITTMLEDAGWRLTDFWTDESEWFAVVHAQSVPAPA